MSTDRTSRAFPAVSSLAAAVLLSAMTAACDRGYPTKDEARVEPHLMNNEQRISAMNRLGREVGRPHPWRYSLEPGCVLRVSSRSIDGAAVDRTASLRGSLIQTAFDRDNKFHGVRLKSGTGDDVALFWSGAWTDAVEMHSLTQSLQAACRVDARSGNLLRGLWHGLA